MSFDNFSTENWYREIGNKMLDDVEQAKKEVECYHDNGFRTLSFGLTMTRLGKKGR